MNNVPNLRFKEFSGDWREIKLGDYVTINSGNSPTGLINEEGVIPYFKVEQLNNSYKYQKSSPYKILDNNKVIPKGSIIFPKRGAAILLNKIRILNQPSFMDTNLMTLTVKEEKLNNEFLYSYLIKENLSKIADTTSIPQINNKHIEPYIINIPILEEQKKIGDFLSLIDKKIELQTEKVEELKNYKKGIMQKIFSQELRFKDENGNEYPEWEIKKLGQLVDIGTGKKDTKNRVDGGKYPFYVRSQIVERINTYSFDGEAILTAGDGVGVGKVFHYVKGKFDYHQRVYKLSDFTEGTNGRYIYEYFKHNFIKEVTKYTAKTSVDSVRMEMITKMNIPYPIKDEQDKIATFCSLIDKKIEKEQEKLELLNQYKKGLLQQMFI